MSFFGSGSGTTGFTGFGTPTNQQPQQQQLRFGTPVANASQAGGFSFGQTATPAPAAGSIFGAVQPQQQLQTQPQQQQIANSSFSFGSPVVNPASTTPSAATGGSGFAFGTSAAPGFSFGTPAVTVPTTTGFAFGSSFGTTTPQLSSPFGSTTGTTAPTGFSFGSSTTPAASGFNVSTSNTAITPTPFGTGFGLKPQVSVATPATLSFGSIAPTIASTTTAATPSFGFTGLTSTPSFGSSPAPIANNPASGFGITTPSTTSAFGSAFNLNTPNVTVNVVGSGATPVTITSVPTGSQTKGFAFGAISTSSATAPVAAVATQPSVGFQLGSASTVQPLTMTPLSSSTVTATATTPLLPSLGLPKPALSTASTTLATGLLESTQPSTATTSASLGFNLSQSTAVTAATTTACPSVLTGFGQTSTASTTSSTTGFAFGTSATKATSGLLTSAGAPTTLTATTMSIATTQPALSLTTTAPQTTPAATTAGTSAPVGPAASTAISFKKFEDDINKWTLELEEQERVFLSQATQVNAWDRILISNGEKITQLNDALERIKLDQEHLDQEIDFIRSQQSELEELLVPLERSVESMPSISVHQHADLEREQTFHMVENIDSQLRLMSKDLKEIIEHLNSSTGNKDVSDPIQQIGKILNSHMDSLQWIDQNTAVLRQKIEEVGRVYDSCRQNRQDKITRLPYI